jgi:hypothetical protein
VWVDTASRARETDALHAFRQGLAMLPEGAARLSSLGLEPAMTRQAALRRNGTRVPDYLFEGLSLTERLAIVRTRLLPAREEMAAFVDPRAATSRRRLLAAHVSRLGRLPLRSGRLAGRWWQARNHGPAGEAVPTPEPSRSRGSA